MPLELDDSTLRAAFTIAEGDRLGFSVRWAPPEAQEAPEPTAVECVADRIADTAEGWRSWEAEHDIYEGRHHDLVRMSSRVLKGLTYRPTGAIVAAPTTSLPDLSSKVLCWTAVDRAVKLAPQLGEYAKTAEWEAAREEIRAAVLERGWSESKQAFAQSFDSDELDAAQLLMPMIGFLPADDERMRSTVEAIASELTEDGLVLRYRSEEGMNADGLTGEEGTL